MIVLRRGNATARARPWSSSPSSSRCSSSCSSGVIEFAFSFNAILAVNFASRNATLSRPRPATTGADCVILGRHRDRRRPRRPITPRSSRSRSTARSRTAPTSPSADRTFYTRNRLRRGQLHAARPDDAHRSRTRGPVNGYPETSRCNVAGRLRRRPAAHSHGHRPRRRADLLRPRVRDAAADVRRDRQRASPSIGRTSCAWSRSCDRAGRREPARRAERPEPRRVLDGHHRRHAAAARHGRVRVRLRPPPDDRIRHPRGRPRRRRARQRRRDRGLQHRPVAQRGHRRPADRRGASSAS